MIDPWQNSSRHCLCKENQPQHSFPVTLISQREEAEVILKVDSRHALANYFKTGVPIFEGSYEFIHNPLCGPSELGTIHSPFLVFLLVSCIHIFLHVFLYIGPSADGKLRFPFYYNPTLRKQPITCIWTLNVHSEKDLSIQLHKLIFAVSSKSCSDAKLEFYLPTAPAPNKQKYPSGSVPGTSSNAFNAYYNPYYTSKTQKTQAQPIMTLCGDSNVGDRKTEISSQLPIISAQKLKDGGPLTIRLDAAAATKLNFMISWTELYQLPKNADGTLMTSKLEQQSGENCGFICPGPEGVCIAKELVCNSVVNCPVPANFSGEHDESESKCKMTDTQFIVFNVQLNVSWVSASVVGGCVALLLCICCVLCCRCCRTKEEDEPVNFLQ